MSVQLHAVGVAMPTTGRWRVPLAVVLEVVGPGATVTTTQSMGSVKSCKQALQHTFASLFHCLRMESSFGSQWPDFMC